MKISTTSRPENPMRIPMGFSALFLTGTERQRDGMTTEGMDIKTLRAVHVLSTCGSVTKAAKILQVTPGAVSYLINKARKATGSSLFFRTRRGMEPNALAKTLSERYRSISDELFSPDTSFAQTPQRVTLSTWSLLELLLTKAVLEKGSFPAKLDFQPQPLEDGERMIRLRNREIDIDIGSRLPVDKSIIQARFMTSPMGVVVSRQHPTIGDSITLEQWQAQGHTVWARGMYFISDDIEQSQRFDRLFREQNVAVVSSGSLVATMICTSSQAIALMPQSVGEKLAQFLPLKWLPAPAEMKMHFECYLHYHHSLARNQKLMALISFLQNNFAR